MMILREGCVFDAEAGLQQLVFHEGLLKDGVEGVHVHRLDADEGDLGPVLGGEKGEDFAWSHLNTSIQRMNIPK